MSSTRCMVAYVFLLGGAAAACGGEVDLGGEGSRVLGEPMATPSGADATGEALAQISTQFTVSTLAVAGDWLFLSGLDDVRPALLRCKKRNCRGTAQLMNVAGRVMWMQPHAGALGVANCSNSTCWLGSYTLPEFTAETVTIGRLPQLGRVEPLFHERSVFWSLPDDGIYRCTRPACSDGPQRLSPSNTGWNGGALRADDELLFWTDGWVLYRATRLGADEAEILVPDERLTVVTGPSSPDASAYDIDGLVVQDGRLYAAVARDSSAACGHQIASFPTLGGDRRVLFESTRCVTELVVQGGELAWVEADERSTLRGLLFSCLVEACASTKRELGPVSGTRPSVVSDGEDWYWHFTSWGGADARFRQLRRTPLIAVGK